MGATIISRTGNPRRSGEPLGKTIATQVESDAARMATSGDYGETLEPVFDPLAYRDQWDQLFVQARSSPAFRSQLISTPESVMRSVGLTVPSGAKVTFHEWDPKDLHIYLEPAGTPFIEVALTPSGGSIESGIRLLKERRPTPYVERTSANVTGAPSSGKSRPVAMSSLATKKERR